MNDSPVEGVVLSFGDKQLWERVSDRFPNCTSEKSHPNQERHSVFDTLPKTHICITEHKVRGSCMEVTWPLLSGGFWPFPFPFTHCLLHAHLSLISVSPGKEATVLERLKMASSKSIVGQQRMRRRVLCSRYFYLPDACMSKEHAGCFKYTEGRLQKYSDNRINPRVRDQHEDEENDCFANYYKRKVCHLLGI